MENQENGNLVPAGVDQYKQRSKDDALNDIKKILYKQKPKAVFHSISKSGILYSVTVGKVVVRFLVPLDEIGDVQWGDQVEAQLLIRYMF